MCGTRGTMIMFDVGLVRCPLEVWGLLPDFTSLRVTGTTYRKRGARWHGVSIKEGCRLVRGPFGHSSPNDTGQSIDGGVRDEGW